MIAFILCACFLLEIEVYAKSYNLPKPIDLTHTVDENTLTWNVTTPFKITKKAEKNNSASFYAANDFCTPEHAGTHLDAPYHFARHGMKVSEIPVDTLIAPGVIVNVSDIVRQNGSDDFLLHSEHLIAWEKEHGAIPTNAIVLIDFGWSWRYSNRTLYFGNEHPPYSFPGLSENAAEWIVKSGRIRGIGVDTPSLDYGPSSVFKVHRILYEGGVFGLENVDLGNKTLPAKGFDLVVLPMKIGGGSGAPVRIVAV